MNRIFLFLFLLFSISASTANCQSNMTNATVKNDQFKITEYNFDIKLQIDKEDKDQYILAATIDLCKDCFVVSPFSEDETYGHFDISIAKTSNLIADDLLLEIPSSMEEFDPILNRQVKFVRINTTYQQKIKVLTEDDFEISGLIWFVLEPSCVPYDVEFTLSYRSGIMEIKKTKTSISKSYKK